jgi:hypothetical protein
VTYPGAAVPGAFREKDDGMTFGPYTNRIPQGLLTADEKAALLATGGPWDFWDDEGGVWRPASAPGRYSNFIYRAVRRPLPVPQEGDVWVRIGDFYWLPAQTIEHHAEMMTANGYRLFREVKA